jgi:hypothetical protein
MSLGVFAPPPPCLNHRTMKTYERVEMKLHAFFNSALDTYEL